MHRKKYSWNNIYNKTVFDYKITNLKKRNIFSLLPIVFYFTKYEYSLTKPTEIWKVRSMETLGFINLIFFINKTYLYDTLIWNFLFTPLKPKHHILILCFAWQHLGLCRVYGDCLQLWAHAQVNASSYLTKRYIILTRRYFVDKSQTDKRQLMKSNCPQWLTQCVGGWQKHGDMSLALETPRTCADETLQLKPFPTPPQRLHTDVRSLTCCT